MTTPKKNVAYEFYIGVISTADTGNFQVNPTIAAGDFQVSTNGGAFANLATLPVVTPAGGRLIKINLSAAEMNANKIVLQGVDAAGNEWDETIVFIDAPDVNITDIVRSTTPANKLDVNATGEAGIDWGNVGNKTTVNVLSGTTIGTTTTNTDMRGTDSALLASSAPANFGDLSITVTTGRVDVGLLDGVVQSLVDLKDFADAGYDPITNKVTGVTLVDTTTINTDMRGTDSAFLAASAPTNFSSLVITVVGAVDSLVQGFLNTLIVETSVGRVAANFDNLYDNANAVSTLTLDTVSTFDPVTDAIANVTLVATTTTNTDMRGTDSAFLAAVMTESYRATNAVPTPAQALLEIIAHLGESASSGTTKTLKKVDGIATAKTYTYDDATNPTSITETT